jgi:large subunit ribosomal protein L4
MEVDIYTLDGKKAGKGTLPDALFGGKVVDALLWEAVKAQRASWRQGTHSTKTRAHVRGGGAKPFKQKGTGQARQGSTRAPNQVGGGVVFGPHPRSYAYKLPKSARRAALRSALSSRGLEGKAGLLEPAGLSAPSTKAIVALLVAMDEPSTLIVGHQQEVLYRSTRNLMKAKYIDVAGLNVYDIVNHAYVLLTHDAVAELERRLREQDVDSAAVSAAA